MGRSIVSFGHFDSDWLVFDDVADGNKVVLWHRQCSILLVVRIHSFVCTMHTCIAIA